MDVDPGGPKTYGSGSATLLAVRAHVIWFIFDRNTSERSGEATVHLLLKFSSSLKVGIDRYRMLDFLLLVAFRKPRRCLRQYCGSGMFIPDPNIFHPGSVSKEFKYFNPKKWFLSSRKYDPGCSSQIRILIFYPSRIPDLGVKKVPDPGSGSATLLRGIKITIFSYSFAYGR
jgi:hypothetical protein